MPSATTCAYCASDQDLKRCGRCKEVFYCSKTCQRSHWRDHKSSCHPKIISESDEATNDADALSLLRSMPSATIVQSPTHASSASERTFSISELRLAILSLLPARDLLRVQGVCRSWYLTIALERKLQQRLFFAPGPGELVVPANTGDETYPGIHPRTKNQVEVLAFEKGMERWSDADPYLMILGGKSVPLKAEQVERTGTSIVLNPFFTMLWQQDPSNMTLSPHIRPSATSQPAASWRRMQVTSPPTRSLGMNLWYSDQHGGNQLLPYTGHIASGVTLGHVADMLAAQPRAFKYHWMYLHGHASWLRSADSVVVPDDSDMQDDV